LEDIETFLAGADRLSHRHGQALGLLSKSSQQMVECDGADQQGRDCPVGDEVTDDGANAALPSPNPAASSEIGISQHAAVAVPNQ
jgi:hypothetical protein